MISVSEVAELAGSKGVPEAQIWHDWIVSHLLQALGDIQHETSVVFYGGTALCRTWCHGLRYSEDIDLLVADFPDAAALIQQRLKRLVRRELPDLSWGPSLSANRMISTNAVTENRSVKVQFVEPRPREDHIPTTVAPVALWYSDLPATVDLTVPTAEGFAAMKLMAWHQRQAPRDLFDLAALAEIGAFTTATLDLTEHVSGTRIGARVLNQKLSPRVLSEWGTQLAHQINEPKSADACLQLVVDAADAAG